MIMRSLLLVAIVSPLAGHAADKPAADTVTIFVDVSPEKAKGSALRPKLNAVQDKIEGRHFAEAEPEIDALCSEYESLFDKNKKQYSFASRRELQEFLRGNDTPFEWIDWGYGECLEDRAFLATERKDYKKALQGLQHVAVLNPISAGAAIELGVLQHQLGNFQGALATYEKGKKLATTYASQKPFLGAALRGIGSTLIDLNRLDDAENAFEESLRIEPGNKIALHELNT